jgi:hypothetical protein
MCTDHLALSHLFLLTFRSPSSRDLLDSILSLFRFLAGRQRQVLGPGAGARQQASCARAVLEQARGSSSKVLGPAAGARHGVGV